MPVTTHFRTILEKAQTVLPGMSGEALEQAGVNLKRIPRVKAERWDGESRRRLHNCYNFAVNYPSGKSLIPGDLAFRRTGPNGGLSKVFNLFGGGSSTFEAFTAEVEKQIVRDGLIPMGDAPDFSRSGYPVAIVYANGAERGRYEGYSEETSHDMHFYALRRLTGKDYKGSDLVLPQLVWAHKPGSRNIEIAFDYAARPGELSGPASFIYDAQDRGYNYFGGYFLVPGKGLVP